jgi:hypothetical protein
MFGFIGRAKVVVPVIALSVCLWSANAAAQPEVPDMAIQRQLLQLQRLFDGLDQAPASRQLFNLYFADLLLGAAPGGLDALGLEEAIGSGARERARRLESSADAEVARQARLVGARLDALLDPGPAAALRTLDVEVSDERRIDTRRDGAPQWVAVRMRRGVEYRIDAGDCPILRVLAVDRASAAPIAGGTVFGRPFLFSAAEDRVARIRIQTPLCVNENDIGIAAAPQAIPVLKATQSAPQLVRLDVRFRGTLSGAASQWFRLDGIVPDHRYVIDVVPLNSTLDPKVTAYDAGTRTELGSDDDGGDNLGSRLEVRAADGTRALFLEVAQVAGQDGEFDLSIRSRPPIGAGARLLTPAQGGRGTLARSGSETWAVTLASGRRYDITASPASGGLDTKITLYDADEQELASDDDGGDGLGSKLPFTSPAAGTYFIVVEAIERTGGDYAIGVVEGPLLAEIAKPAVVGENRGALQAESEEWWEIDLEAGTAIEIEAVPGNSQLDTQLEIYAATSTKLAEDDDGGQGLGSKVTHRAEQAGRIYIRVRRLDASTGEYALILRTAR